MKPARELLAEAGLPEGAPRAAGASWSNPEELRAAVARAVQDARDDPTLVEPLAAWLAAWRHHWAEDFRATLGSDAEASSVQLRQSVRDRSRYLKLRRIAIENLAHRAGPRG